MSNPYTHGAQAVAIAAQAEIGPIIRDQIIDRLMEMPDLTGDVTVHNVRQDHGNIAFDLHVDGKPTGVTRTFSWAIGRYANGEP